MIGFTTMWQSGQSCLKIGSAFCTYAIDEGESSSSPMIALALPPELAISQ